MEITPTALLKWYNFEVLAIDEMMGAVKVHTLLLLFSSMAIRRLKKIFSKIKTRNESSNTPDLQATSATTSVTQSNDIGPGNHIDHALFMIWTLFAQLHPVTRR